MPLFPQIIAVLAMLAFCADAASILKVGNEALSRDLSVEGGILRTVRLTNSLNGTSIQVPEAEEFSLTLSVPGAAAVRLTTTDFEVGGSAFSTEESTQELRVTLEKAGLPVALQIRYWAKQGEAWMRKELRVTAKRDLVIEGMEVERLAVTEAYEPYHANQLTARGAAQWRPPLGQPVYTRQSAAWWGVEFPAARNRATNGLLTCGYLTHLELKAGQSVTSHPVAFGVAEDGAFVKEAFFEYIDATRARPLRLQTQYNSWFDYGQGVSAQKFLQSVKKVDQELMRQRGVPPLRAYVIDDG